MVYYLRMGELLRTSERLGIKERQTVTLNPYQLKTLLSFSSGGKKRGSEFHALDGAVTQHDKDVLRAFNDRIDLNGEPFVLENNMKGLVDFAHSQGDNEVATILSKVGALADLRIITEDDFKNEVRFHKLPLLAQLSFSTLGSCLAPQLREFLKTGGVVSFIQFKKPAPTYLKAVEHAGAGNHSETTIEERIVNALNTPSKEILEASHDFISVLFVPASPDEQISRAGTPLSQHLSNFVNKRIDDHIEGEYAKLIFLNTMMGQEMKGSLYSMVGMVAVLPLLYWLNEQGQNNPLAQTLIKFIPPFLADIITFYNQLKPWLEGDNLIEKLGNFKKRLCTSHKKSLCASIGTTLVGSAAAEAVAERYGDLAGGTLYSIVPFVVAMLTTWDTLQFVKKNTGKPTGETLRTMFLNNPAQLAIDISSFATFATGVALFGFGGQFHNPAAIAAVEGGEEHGLASILTFLQLKAGSSRRFDAQAKQKSARWMHETYRMK